MATGQWINDRAGQREELRQQLYGVASSHGDAGDWNLGTLQYVNLQLQIYMDMVRGRFLGEGGREVYQTTCD